jgi:hypothetical protein
MPDTDDSTTTKTHVTLIHFDPEILADVPGLDLPTTEPRSYTLVDNDAKVCRAITEDELQPTFVDNNIDTFQLLDVNLLTLDVDNQYVTITYTNGESIALLLGSIDYGAPARTEEYGQSNGIIYPIDSAGNLLLNATNTPNLAAIRTWYYNEAKRVNDQRLQIAEVVHAFAQIISAVPH